MLKLHNIWILFSWHPCKKRVTLGSSIDGSHLVEHPQQSSQCCSVQVFRTLRAGPYTRSLAYDPDSEFLASVSAEGTLQVWDMADGKVKFALKGAAPKVRDCAEPQQHLSHTTNMQAFGMGRQHVDVGPTTHTATTPPECTVTVPCCSPAFC